ncbi:putative copine-3 isoform X3, partial [Apostichopus japonicus]
VIKNTLNPVWKPAEVGVRKLCNGDYDKKLKIMCFDHDEGSANDLIGEFYTSARQLMESGTRQIEWDCINPKKKAKKKNYKNSGKVFLTSCEVKRHYTFLDFILGGCQINFTVGIDFTGSNGDPQEATSLHFISDSDPMSTHKLYDKLFPALGFGAKIPPNNEISHEFAINFNANNPFCSVFTAKIDLVSLQTFTHSNRCCWRCSCVPSLFAPGHPMGPHKRRPHHQSRGKVCIGGFKPEQSVAILYPTPANRRCPQRTCTRPGMLLRASPSSHVHHYRWGRTADFTDMRMLDGDDGKLRSPNGEAAARDIVQFVPFRDFKGTSPYHLTKAVLAEIPQQVEAFFNGKNLLPPKFQPAAAS